MISNYSMITTFLLISTSLFMVMVNSEEMYTSRFDDVDIDEVISSDRLLKNYINCLLDKGRCAPDAQELKRVLSDALQTECSKCSEKQKEAGRKVIRHLYKNKPEWWKELADKYDPEGFYAKKHEDELKNL